MAQDNLATAYRLYTALAPVTTPPRAGVDVRGEITQVLRCREGKPVRADGCRDHTEALEAAGPAE